MMIGNVVFFSKSKPVGLFVPFKKSFYSRSIIIFNNTFHTNNQLLRNCRDLKHIIKHNCFVTFVFYVLTDIVPQIIFTIVIAVLSKNAIRLFFITKGRIFTLVHVYIIP